MPGVGSYAIQAHTSLHFDLMRLGHQAQQVAPLSHEALQYPKASPRPSPSQPSSEVPSAPLYWKGRVEIANSSY